MRRSLALLSLLAAAATAASAQRPPAGPPPMPSIPGVSAAGMAALQKLQGREDPLVPKQFQAEAAIRQQMAAALSAKTVDLDKLAAVMAQARTVSANGHKIADDHLLVMLRVLPAADRPAFLRAVTSPPRAAAPAK